MCEKLLSTVAAALSQLLLATMTGVTFMFPYTWSRNLHSTQDTRLELLLKHLRVNIGSRDQGRGREEDGWGKGFQRKECKSELSWRVGYEH